MRTMILLMFFAVIGMTVWFMTEAKDGAVQFPFLTL